MQAGNKGVCRRVREGPEVRARLREASIFTATDPPGEMRNDLISLDFGTSSFFSSIFFKPLIDI